MKTKSNFMNLSSCNKEKQLNFYLCQNHFLSKLKVSQMNTMIQKINDLLLLNGFKNRKY